MPVRARPIASDFVLPGVPEVLTYGYSESGRAVTAPTDLISIVPAAGKVARLVRLWVDNPGLRTTAGVAALDVGYAAAVGSGGGAVTPYILGKGDGDAASSSTVRSLDTTVAAGIAYFWRTGLYVPAAIAAFGTGFERRWDGFPGKGPTVAYADAAAKVLVVRWAGAAGGANLAWGCEWTEADDS